MILDVIQRVAKLSLPGSVERYSVKYANLIPAHSCQEQIARISINIELDDLKIRDELFRLQVHRNEGDVVHILSIVTGALGRLHGNDVFGALVDVDSIKYVDKPDIHTFATDLGVGLEALKQSNKEKFFACLTDEAIEKMGPTYE